MLSDEYRRAKSADKCATSSERASIPLSEAPMTITRPDISSLLSDRTLTRSTAPRFDLNQWVLPSELSLRPALMTFEFDQGGYH